MKFYSEAFSFHKFTMRGFSVRVEMQNGILAEFLNGFPINPDVSSFPGPYYFWQLIWKWLCVPTTMIKVMLFKH